VVVIPLVVQLASTLKIKTHKDFDALLKPLALTTFGTSMLLLVTQILLA
jgi:hypothetical protein